MKVGQIFTENSFGSIIRYEVTKLNEDGSFESKRIGFGPIEVKEEIKEEVKEVKETAPVKKAVASKAPVKKPVQKKK